MKGGRRGGQSARSRGYLREIFLFFFSFLFSFFSSFLLSCLLFLVPGGTASSHTSIFFFWDKEVFFFGIRTLHDPPVKSPLMGASQSGRQGYLQGYLRAGDVLGATRRGRGQR